MALAEPVYLIGPAASIALLNNALVRRSEPGPDGADVRIGDPLYERAGVLNRRGCIAYRWTGAEAARVAMRITTAGITTIAFRDDFPTNWRGSVL